MKTGLGSLEKNLNTLWDIYTVNLSAILQVIYTFTRVTVHWGKENNQCFQGLLEMNSKLTLILGDPKCHCALNQSRDL